MFDITPIVRALVALLCTIITCVVIPYIKSKTSNEKQRELVEWVRIAVTAAEQIYCASGQGAEKKRYVIAWLADRGITVDLGQLDAMIESAVHEMNAAVFTLSEPLGTTAFLEEGGESS